MYVQGGYTQVGYVQGGICRVYLGGVLGNVENSIRSPASGGRERRHVAKSALLPPSPVSLLDTPFVRPQFSTLAEMRESGGCTWGVWPHC